ncbi:hypothetical protein HDU76_011759 [Blyttiomyces sp. JEL0837]|nr:hypothetical protein HDU76_011759 [Blyttiomyces sp. JEL0837]
MASSGSSNGTVSDLDYRSSYNRARHYLGSIRRLNLYSFTNEAASGLAPAKFMAKLLPVCTGLRQLCNVSEDYIEETMSTMTNKNRRLFSQSSSTTVLVNGTSTPTDISSSSLSSIVLTPSSLESSIDLMEALSQSSTLLSRIKSLAIEFPVSHNQHPTVENLNAIQAVTDSLITLLSSPSLRLWSLKIDGDPISNSVIETIANAKFAGVLSSLSLIGGSWTSLAPLVSCNRLTQLDIMGASGILMEKMNTDTHHDQEKKIDLGGEIAAIVDSCGYTLSSLSLYSFVKPMDDRLLKALQCVPTWSHPGSFKKSLTSPLKVLRLVDTPCEFSQSAVREALHSFNHLHTLIFSPSAYTTTEIPLDSLISLPKLRSLHLEHVALIPLSVNETTTTNNELNVLESSSPVSSSLNSNSRRVSLPVTTTSSLLTAGLVASSPDLQQITLRDVTSWHHLINALIIDEKRPLPPLQHQHDQDDVDSQRDSLLQVRSPAQSRPNSLSSSAPATSYLESQPTSIPSSNSNNNISDATLNKLGVSISRPSSPKIWPRLNWVRLEGDGFASGAAVNGGFRRESESEDLVAGLEALRHARPEILL